MAHFLLKKDEWHEVTFDKPWAFVMVELTDRGVLEIRKGPKVAKEGTRWAKLPERIKVIDLDGKVLKPTRGRFFWVTTETFNPFHGLCEAGEGGP